jgi:ABC-2 type transport system ATP-binding protein
VVGDLVEPGPPLEVEHAVVTKAEAPRQWVVVDRRVTSAAEVVRCITESVAIRDLSIEEPEIESLAREVYVPDR